MKSTWTKALSVLPIAEACTPAHPSESCRPISTVCLWCLTRRYFWKGRCMMGPVELYSHIDSTHRSFTSTWFTYLQESTRAMNISRAATVCASVACTWHTCRHTHTCCVTSEHLHMSACNHCQRTTQNPKQSVIELNPTTHRTGCNLIEKHAGLRFDWTLRLLLRRA